MDDTVQNVALGLCAFLALHFSLEKRATVGAERQVREAFDNTGIVRVTAVPRGLLGYEVNDVWAVDVYAQDFTAKRLPFFVTRRGGWKGSIRHLRLHFHDFTLFALPIRGFEADVPFVTYDLGQAFYRSRLSARSAGQGPAQVTIGFEGLRLFASRKFASILSDVGISKTNENIRLTGRIRFFGIASAIVATGVLYPRAGRYLDITDAHVELDGQALSPDSTRLLLQQLNPVLDLVKDVNWGDYFRIESVRIGENAVIITGQATLPPSTGAGESSSPTFPPNTDAKHSPAH